MGPHSPRTVVVTATVAVSVRKLLAPQVAALSDRGWRVVVVTADASGLEALPGISEAVSLPMTRAISPLADLKALIAWTRLLAKIRPEAVVAFSPKASLLSLLAATMVRVPRRLYSTGGLVLETAHGLQLAVLWWTEFLTCLGATRVIANSPSLVEAYRRRYLGRRKLSFTLSRKGVDSSHFKRGVFDPSEVPAVAGPGDAMVVGFVGRIAPAKGLEVLARALEKVADDIRVLVVGGVEDGGDQLVEQLKEATPYITFAGAVSDVRPFYAAMDVLVLPSFREGFPNVVLEGAAMQLPAIVTDATGCRDSVTPETGIIVAAGDADRLAAAISRMAVNADWRLRLGEKARERAIRDFDPAAVIAQQLDLMGLQRAPEVGRAR